MSRRLFAPLLGSALLSVTGLWGAAPVRASNMKDQIIQHFCLNAVTAEFRDAGKTPPAGMADFTCSCVVSQLNARASMDQAKTICRQRAVEKYSLVP